MKTQIDKQKISMGQAQAADHAKTWTLRHITVSRAVVVVCPDCGQPEIWGSRENADHGYCRTQATYRANDCPSC